MRDFLKELFWILMFKKDELLTVRQSIMFSLIIWLGLALIVYGSII